jgi:hypothetical protein
MKASLLRRLGERRALALLACAGYFVASRAAANFYPLSVYDMYASPAEDSSSRIVARDANGDFREVTDYGEWSCPTEVAAEPARCTQFPFYYVPYVDRKAIEWVNRRSSAAGGQPVDVVYRIWRLSADAAPKAETCVLARCSAHDP